jgi:hypothetical protein
LAFAKLSGQIRNGDMVDQNQFIGLIATAIRDMRANYRDIGPGTTRDRIFEGNEESVPFAKAILVALDQARFEIVPKGKPTR